jgi:hypothetical protein
VQAQPVPALLHTGVEPLQLAPQQTLLPVGPVQMPEVHWLFTVHAVLFACLLAQVPPLHQRPAPHCPSPVHGPQSVLPALQAPFGQLIGFCTQLPELQPPMGVSVPFEHDWVPHCVLEPGITHVSEAPSQLPWHTPLPVQALRDGVPPVTGAPVRFRQVPSAPVSRQDSHCALHAVLQQ